jgi:hypothetical protein
LLPGVNMVKDEFRVLGRVRGARDEKRPQC